jgi:hypothetical protein
MYVCMYYVCMHVCGPLRSRRARDSVIDAAALDLLRVGRLVAVLQ